MVSGVHSASNLLDVKRMCREPMFLMLLRGGNHRENPSVIVGSHQPPGRNREFTVCASI